MSPGDRDPRIADNPSAKAMSALMPLVKAVKAITGAMKGLGLKNETVDKIHQSATDVLRQSDVLDLPDRFNDAFADQGWIATQSFGMEAMRRAVELHREGNLEGAEQEILAWFNYDNINLFAVNGSKRFDVTGQRWYQLREALRLTFEERYWSAVPLILIACDGLASDVLGSSPFEKDADLTVFDSLAGHPTSVPALIASLTKGVRKTSSAEKTMPLRHGILHGRSLGYANKVVCMKAWLLMVALVDWACDKRQSTSELANTGLRRRWVGAKSLSCGVGHTQPDRRLTRIGRGRTPVPLTTNWTRTFPSPRFSSSCRAGKRKTTATWRGLQSI